MSKRTFNAHRLYKLIRLLVIISSIGAIIIAIPALNETFTGNQVSSWGAFCEKSYPNIFIYGRQLNDCLQTGIKNSRATQTFAYMSLGIAIFLPVLFFGGGFLYRYLFPIKEEKS